MGLNSRTASRWMKLVGLELTAEEIIAQGGIRAVLSGKPRASKSDTVSDLRSDSELQWDLEQVEVGKAPSVTSEQPAHNTSYVKLGTEFPHWPTIHA